MQSYRIEVIVSDDGTVLINDLPFQAGDKVEVVIRSYEAKSNQDKVYPLRGTSIEYLNPFESVAEDEWGVLA